MKNTFLLGLLLVGTSSAFGLDAKVPNDLLKALEGAGAFVDCGAGTCGTQAKDIQCLLRGNSTDEQTYECTLSVQDETGSMSKKSVDHQVAEALFNALTEAGLQSDCGMGTCGVEASEIQCLSQGNSVDEKTISCTVH